MRFRRVILFAAVITLITISVGYWLLADTARSPRRSNTLVMSFLGRTNDNAVIEIKNRSNQPVWLDDYVSIELRDPEHTADYHPGNMQRLTNVSSLLPGASLQVCLKPPPNGFQ